MPASRAVLTDLEKHGLNPRKPHADLSDDGHLKSQAQPEPVATPKPKKVVKKTSTSSKVLKKSAEKKDDAPAVKAPRRQSSKDSGSDGSAS